MFELVRKNRNRSILLVAGMIVLLAAVGWAAGELLEPGAGAAGVPLAIVVGVVMFVISFYAGDKVLLSAAGARQVTREQAPQLHNVVEEMVIASGLGQMPRVYVIDSDTANAFAAGRNPAVASVAVTDGLLRLLDRDELQAVIAHEIAHVKNRDILFMTLLAVMAGAIGLISHYLTRHLFWFGGGRRSRSSSSNGGGQAQLILFLVAVGLVVLGAITARLVYFAASRTREYMADAGSAIATRNPAALATALEKISTAGAGRALPIPKVAQALLIVGPSLFSTHPPIDKRIAVLRQLAGGSSVSYAEYARRFHDVTGRSARFVPPSAKDQAAVPTAKGKEFVTKVTTAAAGAAMAKMGGALAGGAAALAPGAALRREALDAVKRSAGYEIVTCACGAKIKIPANYPRRNQIRCLGCGEPLR